MNRVKGHECKATAATVIVSSLFMCCCYVRFIIIVSFSFPPHPTHLVDIRGDLKKMNIIYYFFGLGKKN